MTMVDDFAIIPPFFPTAGNAQTLDAVEEHLATVFPVPKTGTLKKIGWRLSTSTLVGTLAVSLETVANTIGVPVATTDAGKTLYAASAVSADIVDPAAGVRFDQINGTTGISVTKGDLISVVVRCKAFTSGACAAILYVQNMSTFRLTELMPYGYTFLGGISAANQSQLQITLEYDGEFVPVFYNSGVYPGNTTEGFNSGSNPDRRGLKFRFLVKKQLMGCYIIIDSDADFQIILYDSDEITAMAGFPITIAGNKRRANTRTHHYIEFPTEPTCLANTFYRLVVLPSTVTNIATEYITPSNDGAILGIASLIGGADFVYTSINGAPTFGGWTDVATQRPGILTVASKTDDGAGAGGGGGWWGGVW